jgi:hypothetical protein
LNDSAGRGSTHHPRRGDTLPFLTETEIRATAIPMLIGTTAGLANVISALSLSPGTHGFEFSAELEAQ